MKKIFKYFLPIALVMCLILCITPAMAAKTAADGLLSWDFNKGTGILTISGNGYIFNFEEFSDTPWFDEQDNIRKVVIEKGVTGIGDNAFNGLKNMTDLSIASSVKYIGNNAFSNCTSLSILTIPEGVTSIGRRAFYNCTHLTTVTIPDTVTTISYAAFSNCKLLVSLNIGKGVVSIENDAFKNCTSLNIVSIKDIVAWCKINFASLTSNPAYFSKTIILNGAKLTDIELPLTLTKISDFAFARVDSLESITIPHSVQSIGASTFSDCSPSLKFICNEDSYAFNYIIENEIEGTLVDQKANIVYPYYGKCGASAYWRLNEYGGFTVFGTGKMNDYSYNTSAHKTNSPWSSLNSQIKSVVLRSGITSIGKYAFYNSTNLGGLTIPHTIKSINDAAFMECGNLLSAIIPDSTTYLGRGVFTNCRKLHSITIGNSVARIFEDTFSGCASLKSANIPNYNNLIAIDDGAFKDCSPSLKLSCYKDGYVYNYALKSNLGTYLIDPPAEVPLKPVDSNGSVHTVKFNSGGGTYIADQEVIDGSLAKRPDTPIKSGYAFEGWYTDSAYKTSYIFTDPVKSDITLYAKWTTIFSEDKYWSNPFFDLSPSAWYYESVKYVVKNNLFNGTTSTMFMPNDKLTRSMLVTVLYRMQKQPEVSGKVSFKDVNSISYYHNAVLWAHNKGVVNGITATQFAPNASITREQLATIMYRYAKVCNYKTSVTNKKLSYSDASSVSSYAVEAMIWADEIGLIKGKTATTINPKDTATRAEVATIIKRFAETFSK